MVSLADIKVAAERIKGYAAETPALESAALNARLGARCFLKPENLQRTGSFKFRGAFNRLAQLSKQQCAAGVVAWSSGNHAQGVAAAAQILEMPATIIMPRDAPAVKLANTKRYGAEVILYDRYTQDREEIGAQLADERGCVLVPSYDDPHIIAGQGTAGLELAAQVKDLDILLVCCGGGGLIAGMSSVYAALSPGTKVYAVEPRDFNDHERSLESGEREVNVASARSFCDALLTPTPGEITFAINRNTLSGGLSVGDDQVCGAMRFAFETLKLVVEPGGAVALAAALSKQIDVAGKRVGIVLSGGNVDLDVFAAAIQP